jgi:hypothetical protein
LIDKGNDLKQMSREYKRKNHNPIKFDFKKASKYLLDKNHGNDHLNINYIHYYPGRIYPYIPLYILSLEDLIGYDGYILDPFAGTGTILLESLINPVQKRNALGVEINPVARLISKVKTTPIDFPPI